MALTITLISSPSMLHFYITILILIANLANVESILAYVYCTSVSIYIQWMSPKGKENAGWSSSKMKIRCYDNGFLSKDCTMHIVVEFIVDWWLRFFHYRDVVVSCRHKINKWIHHHTNQKQQLSLNKCFTYDTCNLNMVLTLILANGHVIRVHMAITTLHLSTIIQPTLIVVREMLDSYT